MTNPSFTFGAGATHAFGFAGVETAFASPAAPEEQQQPPANMEELLTKELAERMADVDELRAQLADARAASVDSSAKLAVAERQCASAQCSERVARQLFETLRQQHLTMDKRGQDYELAAQLQKEVDQLKTTLDEQRKEARDLLTSHDAERASLHAFEQQVIDKNKELTSLRDAAEKLKKDVEHEKAATAAGVQSLEKAYADLTQADDARRTAIKAQDEAEARQHDVQLQFDDLRVQWAEAQNRIEELESQTEAIGDLEKDNAGLIDDIDGLHAQLRDHERTLIVKDERISHLETQFQKERQRNLNAADAAAAAAAASPTDDPPQNFTALGESLEDELAATSDYEESVYEPLEFSQVTETVHLTPVTPTFAQSLTLAVAEAASVAPIRRATPTFAMSVTEATSVTPIEREITTTESYTQIDAHELTMELPQHATLDIAPIEHEITTTASSTQTNVHKLTLEISQHAALDMAPIAPIEVTTATTSTQKVPAKLMTSIIDSAIIDIPPIDAQEIERMPTATTAAQTAVSNPKITVTPMVVTQHWPLEEIEPLRPTSSAGVQTTATEQATDTIPPVIISPKPKTIMLSPKPKKSVLLETVLALFVTLLLIFCAMLYTKLQAWKTANGVGFGYNTYNRGGAYGNGRYLFGCIPIAMDVGSSWWSERVAQTMSVAITLVENWAGITYKPLY